MLYGESDYWVAQYRTLTEGSAQQQVHSVKDPRRGLLARGTALVTAISRRIVRRGVERMVGLDGQA